MNRNLNRELENKFKKLDMKLNKLSVTKIESPNTATIFYSRLSKENNIYVSKDEFLSSTKFQFIVYSINKKDG